MMPRNDLVQYGLTARSTHVNTRQHLCISVVPSQRCVNVVVRFYDYRVNILQPHRNLIVSVNDIPPGT